MDESKIFIGCGDCGTEFDFQLVAIEYHIIYVPCVLDDGKTSSNAEGHLTITFKCSTCKHLEKLEIYGLDEKQFPVSDMPEMKF